MQALGQWQLHPYLLTAQVQRSAPVPSTPCAAACRSTGGKAYYNTNDLNAALRHAINDGSNYYTLGYSPTATNMDRSYRQIEVELRRRKSTNWPTGTIRRRSRLPDSSSGMETLAPLLQFGMPIASGILYGASVAPAAVQPAPDAMRAGQNEKLKSPYTRFDVDLILRIEDVRLHSEPQGNRNITYPFWPQSLRIAMAMRSTGKATRKRWTSRKINSTSSGTKACQFTFRLTCLLI